MDLRCQYASTHCSNMRSLKICGELHRFCLFHRRSANAAQRRWKQKKQAAANATSSASSEDDAIAKPTKTRRRPRSQTDKDVKVEQPIAAKRRRTSREIAAPRVQQAIQQAMDTTTMLTPMTGLLSTLPVASALDTLPPLFSRDDVSLLSQMILGAEETALPLYSPADLWWMDPSYQQDVGVIV